MQANSTKNGCADCLNGTFKTEYMPKCNECPKHMRSHNSFTKYFLYGEKTKKM